MTVITRNLVLDESPTDGTNANNPLVGWHNLVDAGNVSADTQDSDNPAVNLANPSTVLKWVAGDATEQYVEVEIDSTDPVDYVGIARHNLASQAIAVSIEGYSELDESDEPDWQEIVAPLILAGDGPVLFRFAPAVYAGIRVRLQEGDGPAQAAVLYVGKLLVLQRRIYVGHTPLPYGRKARVTNNRSESGNFLGRIVQNETLQTGVDLSKITPAWYREHMDPFIVASKDLPFFFAWRPGDYADEVGYAWMTNDPQPSNERNNGMMQISLQMSGVV